VLDLLEELAKEQRADAGQVRAGLRSIARDSFLPRGSEGVEQARRILLFAADVKALDDLEISGDADMTVTCRVSGFAEDQGRGYESVRKGMQRDRQAETDRDEQAPCPDERDSVPSGPPTGQDRTGEKNTPTPPEGGTVVRFRRGQVPKARLEL